MSTAIGESAETPARPAGKPLHARNIKMQGKLHKWTNYLSGYRSRWFVLADDGLFYYFK